MFKVLINELYIQDVLKLKKEFDIELNDFIDDNFEYIIFMSQSGSQTENTLGYSISKLALNGLTLQLANELHKDNILINATCPGWVRTQMGGLYAPRTPEQGAEGIVWAALLEDNTVTGKFLRNKQVISW